MEFETVFGERRWSDIIQSLRSISPIMRESEDDLEETSQYLGENGIIANQLRTEMESDDADEYLERMGIELPEPEPEPEPEPYVDLNETHGGSESYRRMRSLSIQMMQRVMNGEDDE